jgi:hypothetical protein
MNAISAGLLSFLCAFVGAMAGLRLAKTLPAQHLDSESKDVVRISMATVATLSALVLGLLIASAKESFDDRASEFRLAAAQTVELDRTLAAFGPSAAAARAKLREIVEQRIAQMAPRGFSGIDLSGIEKSATIGAVQELVLPLVPQDDNQRWLKDKALSLASDIAQTRVLLIEQGSSSVQWPFLLILMFWLGTMFLSFGIFAPHNPTVVVAFLVASFSIASSMFMILEMDDPYQGVIHISDEPMRQALSQMGLP